MALWPYGVEPNQARPEPRRRFLDIEVHHFEGVLFDELASGLDRVSHEHGEDLAGVDLVVNGDLEEDSGLGIHGRVPELRWVHLAEPLVALDLEAFLPRGEQIVDELFLTRELPALGTGRVNGLAGLPLRGRFAH